MGVRSEEVSRGPRAFVRSQLQQPREKGQIVLGIVDRIFRALGRGPANPRIGGHLGARTEFVEAG